ncbi:MAG: AmmeMemoRadiSam system radical SAM enzyme [bacterium]
MNRTRREFLKGSLCAACGAWFWLSHWGYPGSALERLALADSGFDPKDPHLREAYFYEKLTGGKVRCQTCPNTCLIKPDRRGRCETRVNLSGKLYSISYGNPCTVNVDPVEKKPLLHFYPGSLAFSLAVAGCNFHCLNCQNWEISQTTPDKTRNLDLPPDQAVRMALQYNCKSLAYTYSEATTFYEYMVDISARARPAGLKNIYVSNGYISPPALDRLCTVIDAGSINLKSFSDDIYRKLNGGHLEPVLNTLKTLHRRGIWLEIINLVIPTYTDDLEMIKRMCGWIARNLGPECPLHFSRFTPKYKLAKLPPTPVEILQKAREAGIREGLHHVYIGNVPGMGEEVICPGCRKTVVKRQGYTLASLNLEKGKCRFCKQPVSGRWE